MAKINLRDYLAAISVKTENADLDKIAILDSSDGNAIKTILKEDLVDLNEIVAQLQDDFVRFGTGAVSESSQISFNGIVDKPTLVSQSSQIDVTQTENYDLINQYTDSDVKVKLNIENVISSSAQVTSLSHLTTTNLDEGNNLYYTDSRVKNKLNSDGIFSSSAQLGIYNSIITLTAGDGIEGGGSIRLNQTSNEEITFSISNGIVSGSNQINHDSTIGYVSNEHINHSNVSITGTNGLSGGGNITSNRTITLDTNSSEFNDGVKSKLNVEGIVSQSSQVNADSITNFDSNVKDKLNAESVISSSAQLGVNDNTITISGSTDGAVLINGVAGGEFTLNQSSNETFTISLANGLVSGSVIREIPIGTISSSAQIYSTFSGSNLVSQSSQINADSITNFDSNVLTYLNSLGVQSGSDTPHYTDSDTLDYINSINVISQSSQIVFNDIDSNPFESSTNQITASGHIVPSQHESYDLGSPTQRWRTLYLSGSTIDLGGTLIKRGNDGRIRFIDRTTELVKSIDIDSITGSLEITGDLSVTSITASRLQLEDGNTNNILIGGTIGHILDPSSGTNNIFIGDGSGDELTTGDYNIGIGVGSLGDISDDSSDGNVAIGHNAAGLMDSGSYNVSLGVSSMYAADFADYAVGIGYVALYNGGDYNIGVGYRAGFYLSGAGNIAIGRDVGYGLNSGAIYNTGIGYRALSGDGTYNNSGGGDNNTTVGFYSLGRVQGGVYNSVLGSNAARQVTQGSNNTVLGGYSGHQMTTGDNNVLLGFYSGYFAAGPGPSLITGDGNTLLGTRTQTQNDDDYNSIVIGSGSIGNGSNTVVIGNDSITSTELKGDVTISGSISGSSILLHGDGFPTTNNVSISVGNTTSLGYLGYGYGNVMVGVAGRALQSGSNNIGIGSALTGIVGTSRGGGTPYSVDMPSDNIGIGRSAANGIVTGSFNIAIGGQALQSAEADARGNVAIGNLALFRAKGDYNTAVGQSAAYNAGFQTTAIGAFSGFGLKEGANYNTGIGYASVAGSAAYNQSTGDHNTGTGYRSLQNITSGSYNAGFGGYALSNVTDGDGNISVGYSSGTSLTTGSYNVLLGWDAETLTVGDNNSIVIGKQARGKGSNTVVIGNDDITTTYLNGKLNLAEPGYNLVIDSGPENRTGGSLSNIGNNNILLGRIAGDDIVAGDNNIAIGTNSLGGISDNTSSGNIAIGESALFAFQSGSNNVAIGRLSSRNRKDGSDQNVSIGYYSGYNATGDYSVSIGAYAGKYATSKGVYIGADVGNGLGTGSFNNTGVGGDSLGGDGTAAAGSGDYNAAFGFQSLRLIKDGSYNTSIGARSSELLTDGSINTSVGYFSLPRLTTGENNVAIGYRSGYTLISGSGNTLLGTLTDTQNSDDYNSIVIGSGSIGNGSNTVVIGNSLITDTYTRGTVHIEEVIKLTPLGSLPSGEDGMVASYDNQLWYHNGSDWQALAFA